jgi:hypothetical protein
MKMGLRLSVVIVMVIHDNSLLVRNPDEDGIETPFVKPISKPLKRVGEKPR